MEFLLICPVFLVCVAVAVVVSLLRIEKPRLIARVEPSMEREEFCLEMQKVKDYLLSLSDSEAWEKEAVSSSVDRIIEEADEIREDPSRGEFPPSFVLGFFTRLARDRWYHGLLRDVRSYLVAYIGLDLEP